VRQDDPSFASGPGTTQDQRRPARVRTRALSGALGVLILATSLAVASVSVWLVLPYLALMAVILITPPGRRRRHEEGTEASDSGRGRGEELAAEPLRTGTEDDGAALIDRATSDPATVAELVVEPAEVSASDPDSDSEPRAVKTKRGGSGKGRLRKAKAVVASPGATATWIQVGPGKFVRVEAPGPGPQVAAESPPPGGTDEAEGANTGGAEDTEVLASTLEAPSEPDEIASEGGDIADAAPARDPENQAPAASEEPLVAEDDPDPATEMEETSDSDLSTDAVAVAVAEGDNGIAPDAFDVVPPALTVTRNEILTEDASSPEPNRVTPEPAVRSEGADRRTVGTLLAPRRGVEWSASSLLSERSRSRAVRDVSSSRRRVRSGRKSRVSPALRPRSRQRGTVRPRQARRIFPPRSPPAPMGRLRCAPVPSTGTVPGPSLGTHRGDRDCPRCSFGWCESRREIAARVPVG
jgi:hypothetical protein